LHAVRNCRIGRAEVDDEHGLTVGELLFDRPISRGETHLIEYSLTNAVRRTRNAARVSRSLVLAVRSIATKPSTNDHNSSSPLSHRCPCRSR
jgi:hypothetical protein